MAVAVDKVSKYLLSKIDQDDHSAVEIIQRYVDLLNLFRKMQAQVRKDGPSVEIKNGEQSYVKAHPLISDMKNINAQLLNIKKEIDRYMKEYELKLIQEKNQAEYSEEELT